jgi:hypothetical protein
MSVPVPKIYLTKKIPDKKTDVLFHKTNILASWLIVNWMLLQWWEADFLGAVISEIQDIPPTMELTTFRTQGS